MRYTLSPRALILATLFLAACGGGDSLDGPEGGDGGSGAGNGSGASGGSGGSGTTPSGDVVINEIHYDPATSADDAGEWVELFNATSETVELEGWVLRDTSSNTVVLAPLAVEPGGYAVLGRSTSLSDNGGAPVDQAYGDDFKLANESDSVVLERPDGSLVDQVSYETAAPWPLGTAGVSIELAAPDLDNALPGSWQHAVLPFGDGDLGTPGGPNGGAVVGYTVDDSVVSWQEPNLKTTVLFAPLDDLEGQVIAVLDSAQTSIDLAFFNIRLDAVRDLLIQKKNAGVSVNVVLDAKQQELEFNTIAEELTQAGVAVTLVQNDRSEEATMHDKFAVVDGHMVMTGSANYSYTALHVSDEDLITFDDAALAQRYELELDELIASTDAASQPYSGAPALSVWMGPEDNLEDKAVSLLESATTSAVVAVFEMNMPELVDALIEAKGRGVNVAVILDQVQADKPDADAEVDLAAAGIPVVLAHNTGNQVAEMHSKFLVVDHQHVMMGSYNWTNMASHYNDENVVLVHDAHLAARFEGKFAALVDAYNATPTALGLTTGSQSVTFAVGNVALDPGVKLYVVGNGPLASGVELASGSVTLDVSAGTRLDYHYEIRHGNTTLALESADHSFTVPYAPGPFAVSDAFVP